MMATTSLAAHAPTPGQLVEVRRRQWVVADVDAAQLDTDVSQYCLTLLAENDRVRFTISDYARDEFLRRFAELNRQRDEEEVAQGLQGSGTARTSSRPPRAGSASRATPAQPSLNLDVGAAVTINVATRATAILRYLNAHEGWQAKVDCTRRTRP